MSVSDVSSQQTIKPRGTIQNMLNQSFSERACISENIDDSLGAQATKINIYLDTKTKQMVHSDNGVGMTKDGCFEAHCLNTRKDKSKERQGRFGIGRKQAQAVLNNLESTTKTLTKSKNNLPNEGNDEGLIELDINWKECIEKDMYQITPHDVTTKSLPLWTKYAIDPKKTGTVTVIPCSKKIFESIQSQVISKKIVDSLIFHLGRTYYKYLESGVTLNIYLDGTLYPIVPVNPTVPSYKEKDTRITHRLAVFENEGEIRVYYKDENGKDLYRDFSSSTVGKQVVGDVPKSWKLVGRFDLTCMYLSSLQPFHIDLAKYDIPTEDGQGKSGIQELRAFLFGSYYSRNGKVITRFNIVKPTSGDRAHYKYFQDIIQFIEFDSDLDDFFDIQVNKSKIDESCIGLEIRQTIKYLTSEFSRQMIWNFCSCDACVKPKTPVAPAAPANTLDNIIQVRPKQKSDVATATPAPAPAAPAPTPAPAATPTPTPAPAPIVAPKAPAPTVTTHVIVPAHTREQSKSAKDLVGLAMSLSLRIMNSNVEEVFNRASAHAQGGYVKYWNSLREIEDLLRELGVEMEEA